MSAIQKELCTATGTNPSKFADRGTFLVALTKAVNDLSDDDWAKLTPAGQDWTNAAADQVKVKKTPAEFPDAEDDKPTTRSRNRAEPEAPAGEATAVEDIVEGQQVKITFKKRGGQITATGEVVEVSKRKGFLVVKEADGEEAEISYENVTATEVFHGDAGSDAGDEAEAVLAVGAEVEFTTKRGKTVTGVVKELNEKDNFLVLESGDDYDLDKAVTDSMKIIKGAAAAEPEPEKTAGRGRNRAEPETPPADGDKPKRSSNPKGVSVGGRIRELVAENPDITEEAVGKALTKDGIEFRPPTLSMIFKDCANLITLLREHKHMKK